MLADKGGEAGAHGDPFDGRYPQSVPECDENTDGDINASVMISAPFDHGSVGALRAEVTMSAKTLPPLRFRNGSSSFRAQERANEV